MAINKNKINDNALRYIQKGQIKKAIREYDKILAEDPNDVRTLLKKGDLLVRVGDRGQAVDSYLRVADTYSRQGFHLKAVAVFKQILKIDPNRVDVNLRLAEEYQNLGIVGDAMSHLQIVAAFYEQNEQSGELLEILRRMVDLDPDNIPSRIKLAEMYSREGMVPEAVEEFTKAAEDLKAANRIEDYIKVCERLIYHDASNLELIKELANIYLQRGDTKRALGKLQICFKADPQDLDVLGMLAQAFQDLNQLSKTVSVYKEIAKIYQERQEPDRAQQVYRRVLELSPDDPEARQALQDQPLQEAPIQPEEEFIELEDEPAHTLPTASVPPLEEEPTQYAMPSEAVLEEVAAAPEDEIDLSSTEFDAEVEPEWEVEPDDTSQPAEVVAGPSSADQETISRLLTETAVYIKYGLQNKAYEHLTKVFEIDPHNIEAHEKLKEIYLQAGQLEHAAQELVTLVQLCSQQGRVDDARGHLRALLALVPDHPQGQALARELGEPEPAPVEDGEVQELPGDDIEFDIEDDIVAAEEPTTMGGVDIGMDEQPVVTTPGQPPQVLSFDGEETVDAAAMPTGELSLDDAELLAGVDVGGDAAEGPEIELVEQQPAASPEPDQPEQPVEQELIDLGDDEQFFVVSGDDEAVATQEPDLDRQELADHDAGEPLEPEPTTEPSAEFAAAAREAAALAEAEPEAEEAAGEEDLEDALEELDFFIQQNLLDEAEEELARLLEIHGEREELLERRQKLEQLQGGSAPEAEPEAESFDLASELEDGLDEELAAAPLDEDFQYSFEDVFSEFKKGVAKVLDSGDSATHYDLGIAYKEMGLMDDAINEFQVAAQDENRRVACMSMIGLCLKEKGQYSEAINRFKDALHGPGLGEQEATGIYYEMGHTYELLGDNKEAAFYYNKVYKRDANFRNVAARLKQLQGQEPDGSPSDDKKRANPKSNISYM